MLWLAVIAVIANVEQALTQCDYCSPPNGPTHTMCLPVVSPACGESYTFSEDEQAAILNHHNTIRQRVAAGDETLTKEPLPPACSMCTLQWQAEAATIAQRLTDNCTFSHDTLRDLCDGTYCGQNLVVGSYSSKQTDVIGVVINLINVWYESEAPNFGPGDICTYKFDTNTGHFTQLIWGDTCYMGCGLTIYQENGWWKYLVACNYCTGGNYIGQPVYTIPCNETPHCEDCC